MLFKKFIKINWFNKVRVDETSVFTCSGKLSKTAITVTGNNKLTIGSNTNLTKMTIVIRGENNCIQIGNDCSLENDMEIKAAPFED